MAICFVQCTKAAVPDRERHSCAVPGTETLLIVDQFEELLTETEQRDRGPFVDLLMVSVVPIRSVISIAMISSHAAAIAADNGCLLQAITVAVPSAGTNTGLVVT
jgi:hypothetical protein